MGCGRRHGAVGGVRQRYRPVSGRHVQPVHLFPLLMPAQDSPSAPLAGRADLILIALFIAILAVPGLGLLIGADRAQVSEAEMRALTALPQWSWQRDQLATWPDRFQRYFNDRFAFRNELI